MSPSHRRSKWVAQTHWVRQGGKELAVAAGLVVATALGLLSVVDLPSLWGRGRPHPIQAGRPEASAAVASPVLPASSLNSFEASSPGPGAPSRPLPPAQAPELAVLAASAAAGQASALPSAAAASPRPAQADPVPSSPKLASLASPKPHLDTLRPPAAAPQVLAEGPLSYPSPTPLWEEDPAPAASAPPPRPRPSPPSRPKPRPSVPLPGSSLRLPAPSPRAALRAPGPQASRVPVQAARPPGPVAKASPASRPGHGRPLVPRLARASARPGPRPAGAPPSVAPQVLGAQVRPVAQARPGGPLRPPAPARPAPTRAAGGAEAEGAWGLAADGRPKRHLAGGWRPWPGGRVGHVRQVVPQGQDLALGLAPQEQALWLLQWPQAPGAKAQAALVLGPPGAWGGAQAAREGLRHPTSLAIAPQGDWVWVAEAKGGLVRYHLPTDRMERPRLDWGPGGPPQGALFLEPRQGAVAPLWEPRSGRRWRLRLQEGRLEPGRP